MGLRTKKMAQRVRCLLQKHKDPSRLPAAKEAGTEYGRPHLLLQLQEAETGGSRGPGQFSAFPEVTITTNQFQNLFLLKEKPGV